MIEFIYKGGNLAPEGILENILPLSQHVLSLRSEQSPVSLRVALGGQRRGAWCVHLQGPWEHWRAACGMSDAGRGASECSAEMLMLQIKPKQNMFLSCLLSIYCVFWKPKLTGLRQRRRV